MMPRNLICGLAFCAVFFLMGLATPARPADKITFRRNNQQRQIEGKVLVEAQDGGLLVLSRDGVMWAVQPNELVDHKDDKNPFRPFTMEKTAAQLKTELPDDFEIYQTRHYIICYNTSTAYAEWCGALFERLYRNFHAFWKNKGFTLRENEFPLVALVFNNRDSYARYAKPLLGEAALSMIGYYNLATNRMIMYDLTGAEGARRRGERLSTAAHINRVLSRPGAALNVATIIHEATHQLAYNCGLHDRSVKIPLWVSEGLAVYFEQPDLNSSKGWRTIGAVNRHRLITFRRYLRRREKDSLLTLLADNQRFLDPKTASEAYAEAWALTYFLLRSRTKQYVKYLQDLSRLPPLTKEKPDERVKRFKSAFGDLDRVDAEFLRYVERVRVR